jgi:hypothetical protein
MTYKENFKVISEMKKVLIPIILIQLFACENVNICPNIIKGKPKQHLISDQELNTVKSLFESNNLSLDNFLVYWLQRDDLGYTHVRCYQYINNLNVFSNEVIFHFDKQNHYCILSGELISDINIRPYPSMSTWEVGKLFLQSIKNDGYNSDKIKQYEDGCFFCELGYYDLNAGISYASQNFKLAWKIRPENSEYPIAYINDSDNSVIYYFSGIIID